jgi:uncharacterized alkaline shock family protein YloU
MAKWADRFLLIVYSFVIGIALILLLFMAFNWIGFDHAVRYLDNVYRNPAVAYPFIAVAIVLLLISVRLFILGIRRPEGRMRAALQMTEYGLVRVSYQALQNLAASAASEVQGIHDLKTRIRSGKYGLEIDLFANVDGRTAIPELSERLQTSVKEHVERMSGLSVAAVTVLIGKANAGQPAPPVLKSRVE